MGRRGLTKFRTVKNALADLGIIWRPARGKGSHGCFVGPHQQTSTRHSYPIPSHQQREMNVDYLKGLRRRFGLNDKKYDSLFS